MISGEGLPSEKDSVHECQCCELEHRMKAVMSQSRWSPQQVSQHVACQTVTTGDSVHVSDLNMGDSCSGDEAHLAQVML